MPKKTTENRVLVNQGEGWVREGDLRRLTDGAVDSIQIYSEPCSPTPRNRPIKIVFMTGERREVEVEYQAHGYTQAIRNGNIGRSLGASPSRRSVGRVGGRLPGHM